MGDKRVPRKALLYAGLTASRCSHAWAGSLCARGMVLLWLTTSVCADAWAESLWDGLWYRNNEKSRQSDHSYSLTRLPTGMWQYSDGSSTYLFAADGKPHPEPMAPDFNITATLDGGGNVMDLLESAYGREMERWHRVLSRDGATLTGTHTRVYPDGREVTSDTTAVRVSGGPGFEGRWKEIGSHGATKGTAITAPKKAQSAQATSDQARRPYWVISTSAHGVMSWFIPATGELIRGKADGRSRPIVGPQQPAGRTFVWKQVSPNRLEFYASDNEHLIATAIETLSPDGKTFTDDLWATGHENEKDLNVYEKQ